MLLDRQLPRFDFVERHAVKVAAAPAIHVPHVALPHPIANRAAKPNGQPPAGNHEFKRF